MAQTYATPADVVAQYGPVADETQVETLLNAAYVKVLVKVPDLERRVLTGAVMADAVKQVLVEMVMAVLRNPTGQRSGSENAGPFGKSWSWDTSTASGRLAVTDEHLEMLGELTHGAYTVSARDDGLRLYGGWMDVP